METDENWRALRNNAAIAVMPFCFKIVDNLLDNGARLKKDAPKAVAELAVMYADALIAELKNSDTTGNEVLDTLLGTKISDTSLSIRAINILKTKGCKVVGDITKVSEAELYYLRNCGKTRIAEIRDFLTDNGLSFRKE